MAKYINFVLISIAAFFLTFCWLTFYKQATWICYVVSAILAIMALVTMFALSSRLSTQNDGKSNKKSITKAQKNALALLTDYESFDSIFVQQGLTVKPVSGDSRLVAGDKQTFVAYLFKLSAIGAQDAINAYKQAKKNNADNIVIFCLTFDGGLKEFLNKIPLPTKIMDFASTQKFLKENHKSMPQPQQEKKDKLWDKKIFYFAFNKSRFKYYFFVGISLLLLSKISFYFLYNIIMATVCFALSVYCLFNKRFNTQIERLCL